MVNSPGVSVFDSPEEYDVISFAPRSELQPASNIASAAADPDRVARFIIRKFVMANSSRPRPHEAARPLLDTLREIGDKQARSRDNCARRRDSPEGSRRRVCRSTR